MGAASLVGRDAELTVLRGELARAAQGEGRTLFVLGAPGMGKTALARGAVDLATERGIQVLAGRAWPLDGGLAYAPIIDAIGPRIRDPSQPEATALVTGLPALGGLFPGVDATGAPTLGDPALEKTRLFESIAVVVERMTVRAPVMLWVDDVHYADVATLELLQYLSRRLCDAPALLILTGRPGAAPTMDRMVRQGRLGGTAETLELGRLDDTALRAFAERTLGGKAPDELVAILSESAGGVPFFVQATLSALQRRNALQRAGSRWRPRRDASSLVPEEVHDLVRELVEELDASDRVVLEFLAVAGTYVTTASLRAVCPADAPTLDRLRASGMVVTHEDTPGEPAHAIAHPLLQEAIHRRIESGQRTAMHRRFLGAQPGDGPHLARHVRNSGPEQDDPRRSLRILLRASALARERYAPDEAANWLSAALALVRRYALAHPVVDILEPLGEALSTVGETSAAVEIFGDAVELHDREGDVERAAEARCRLALLLWDLGRLDTAASVVAEGLAKFGATARSPALARLTEVSIRLADRRGDHETVKRCAAILASWAGDAGAPFEVDFAHMQRFSAEGRILEALAAATRASANASNAGERLRAGTYLAGTKMLCGTIAEEDVADYRRLLREARLPSTPALGLIAGSQRLYAGDPRAAVTLFEEAIAESPSSRRVVPLHAHVCVAWSLLGRFSEASAALALAKAAVGPHAGDAHIVDMVRFGEAVLAVERNDREAATELAQTAVPAPFEIWWACAFAQTQLVAGDVEAAAQRAKALAERFADIDFGRAWSSHVLGLAERARSDTDAARPALSEATRTFDRLGMPLFAARSRLAWAELEGTPREEAKAAARACIVAFERAGAVPWSERGRALLRQLGDRAAVPRVPRGDATLSARELEVARLAAAGRTNAEIGRALFISPHTAATHMRKILKRTGVHNRAALGRWLTEHGLLQARQD